MPSKDFIIPSMANNTPKSDDRPITNESRSRDKFHGPQGKKYEIRRRAPSPPKFRAASTIQRKSFNDSHYVRYSNIESIRGFSEDFSTNAHECLISIINRLIEKEHLFVLTLKTLMKELETVSTNVCNKLPLLKDIINFHSKILIRNFLQCSASIDVPLVFKQYEDQYKLHITFTYMRKDFSYLVSDLCESVVDNFKGRLLEYNFTISQIKGIYKKNVQTRITCNEAEDNIKKVFQEISDAMKHTEEEEQRDSFV